MKDNLIYQGKTYISARRAAEFSGYTSDYIGQLCRSKKLQSRMVGRSWFVSEDSLQDHKERVAEEEANRNRLLNLYGGKAITMSRSSKVEVRPRKRSRKLKLGYFAGTVVSVLAFLFIFMGATYGLNVIAGRPNPGDSLAQVGGAYSTVTSYIQGAYSQVIGMFSSAADVSSLSSTSEASAASLGVAVVPSSSSSTEDQAMKQKILDTFSDQVNVRGDLSGTAGVITPVFKKTTGKDFMYVLVPVKKNTK